MIEEIVRGISRGLSEHFKDHEIEYTIYDERVEQGLKVPCFFVLCKSYSDELYRGKRYRRKAEVSIEYVTDDKSESINKDMNSVIEVMYDITEVIEAEGNELRGIERKVEKNEKGFVFSVNYEYFYYKDEDIDKMEILKQEGVLKNGGN